MVGGFFDGRDGDFVSVLLVVEHFVVPGEVEEFGDFAEVFFGVED